MSTKILLAGPGTGKTTKVKNEFLKEIKDFDQVLVLSFTNATINDLRDSFAKSGIPIDERNCMTLHSYALRINHQDNLHVLNNLEERTIEKYAKSLGIDFTTFCQMLDSITYDQMITGFLEFAKTNPEYLKEKIGDIKLLIVDEFQDFNDAEQELVHLVAEHAQDTLILGDDDQAIYGFKDATSVGIVTLHNDASVENIEHENVCYRCPDIIVEKCKNLLSKNKQRVEKDWHPSKIEGSLIFEQHRTLKETLEYLVGKIEETRSKEGIVPILVLSPVKLVTEDLPALLEEKEIPFVNFFTDGIDIETYTKIWQLKIIYTKNKVLNLILSVIYSDLNNYRKGKFKATIKKHSAKNLSFDPMYDEIKEFLPQHVVTLIDNPIEFEKLLEQDDWNSLKDVMSEIEETDPEKILEKIDRFINPPTVFDEEAVNIMSIYKSKGLQAPHVFIVGLVDGIIPRETKGVDEIEEERRRLFVGMTRSQKDLYLLSTVQWDAKYVHRLGRERFTPIRTGGRYYNGRTSPFINELNL